jgi:hypothetical protein
MNNTENFKQISTPARITSCLLKTVGTISALAGVYMSAAAGRNSFMGGRRVFMFFTIQSNIAIALICAIGLILIAQGRQIRSFWFIIKFMGTISITLTGAVFCFVLAPVFGPSAWNPQNLLTHVIVPLAAIADFFVTGIYGDLKKSSIFFCTLPPLAYVIYAGIGYAAGWEFTKGANYPYFFLNWGSPAGAFGFTKELPFMGCVWWILLLLLLLLLVGLIYLAIIDAIRKAVRS